MGLLIGLMVSVVVFVALIVSIMKISQKKKKPKTKKTKPKKENFLTKRKTKVGAGLTGFLAVSGLSGFFLYNKYGLMILAVFAVVVAIVLIFIITRLAGVGSKAGKGLWDWLKFLFAKDKGIYEGDSFITVDSEGRRTRHFVNDLGEEILTDPYLDTEDTIQASRESANRRRDPIKTSLQHPTLDFGDRYEEDF